jgi:hypothetical protein
VVACWLRHHAASRKVTGSNPDEVAFLNWPNPSGHTMALGSIQPLTNEYQEFLKIKKPRADNSAAIYWPFV